MVERMAMISAPRTLEVKLVRFAETAAEERINALLAEGLVMLQCVGMADTMVMLRYAKPMFEGKQEIRLVRLGDVDAEERINLAVGCDFMPMGHVGSRSQYLLMSRIVDAHAGASGEPNLDVPEHVSVADAADCDPRQRRDN